jgi:hypothetical protein
MIKSQAKNRKAQEKKNQRKEINLLNQTKKAKNQPLDLQVKVTKRGKRMKKKENQKKLKTIMSLL